MGANLKQAINLAENAITVLNKRYLKRDKEGNPIEKPEDMFWRVAHTIAMGDKEYNKNNEQINSVAQEFYNQIAELNFMPNSPTLMNAGRELGQLSACFVLPVDDSLDAIFETIKNTALIHKSGGGTGFSFSRLRPKNDVVRSTMGVSSGPISFIEVFNAATEAVKQGGTRRGANMGILRVDHPDIMDFINAKFDGEKLTNFNISVAITNKFMKAVEDDTDYELFHPRTKKVQGTLKAKEVFDVIVDHAWKNGEPGIIFIDNINKYNPTPLLGEIESTNPCGEIPLLPYEACNLGSINLGRMLKTDEQDNICVDWDKLAHVSRVTTHFLDNVITMNKFPLPKIEEMAKGNRKVGLGVMGWADMLNALNIAYNSEEGIKLASQIMEFIDYNSKVRSIELSQERGRFLNFEGSVYDTRNFLYEKYQGKSAGMITDKQWLELDKKIHEVGIRNATTTCIAPTGTISMIAGASGGIEPLFSIAFFRQVMDDTKMIEVNPLFKKIAKDNGFYSDKLMEEISIKGTVHGFENVPENVQKIFVTAHDIAPKWHIQMQAAYQLHNDNAVSKTINFEEDASRQDIAESYMLAHKYELKGTTVYRNNSRVFQPMALKEEDKKETETKPLEGSVTPRKRPDVTYGITDKIETGCGPLYITINSDGEGLCEVFARMGKSGGCATSQTEATGRMISVALRAGVSLQSIIDQLKGIRCPSPSFGKGGVVLSCSDAIAKVLERNADKVRQIVNGGIEIPAAEKIIEEETVNDSKVNSGFCPECPECGQMLEFGEGCVICKNCGYSKCS